MPYTTEYATLEEKTQLSEEFFSTYKSVIVSGTEKGGERCVGNRKLQKQLGYGLLRAFANAPFPFHITVYRRKASDGVLFSRIGCCIIRHSKESAFGLILDLGNIMSLQLLDNEGKPFKDGILGVNEKNITAPTHDRKSACHVTKIQAGNITFEIPPGKVTQLTDEEITNLNKEVIDLVDKVRKTLLDSQQNDKKSQKYITCQMINVQQSLLWQSPMTKEERYTPNERVFP